MMTLHVPKLLSKYFLLFFFAVTRMSGKSVNFDDKKKSKEVNIAKAKK